MEERKESKMLIICQDKKTELDDKFKSHIISCIKEKAVKSLFICPRCHKSYKYLSRFYRHVNRKQACFPFYSIIDNKKIADFINVNINKKAEYECKYCNKKLTNKSNKYYHEHFVCSLRELPNINKTILLSLKIIDKKR
jgi:uncharacterized C2H2 Zn-finger protein